MSLNLPDDKRILITRTDRIGDLVLTTPLFKALREKFPKAWLVALVFAELHSIVQGNPYLDEVILYDKKGSEKSLWGQFRFAWKLRKKKFDVVIHCHGTNRMHVAGWLAGIPVRIGYDRRSPWALTEVHCYNKKEGKKHETEYLFELLKDLGVSPPSEVEAFFPIMECWKQSVENLLFHLQIPTDKPWILIGPAATDPSKIWPNERFAELVERIDQAMPCVFFAIGTQQDRSVIEKVKKNTAVPIFDLSGRLNLGMLGAMLQKAALFISNDSGPVYMAAAIGTPVISIFGRYEPGIGPLRWRPLGKNVRLVTKDVSHIPVNERKFTYIDEITVDEVYKEVKKLI